MATHTAAEGTVTVKPTDSGTATSIGSITSFSLDENVEVIDKTLLRSTSNILLELSLNFSKSFSTFSRLSFTFDTSLDFSKKINRLN